MLHCFPVQLPPPPSYHPSFFAETENMTLTLKGTSGCQHFALPMANQDDRFFYLHDFDSSLSVGSDITATRPPFLASDSNLFGGGQLYTTTTIATSTIALPYVSTQPVFHIGEPTMPTRGREAHELLPAAEVRLQHPSALSLWSSDVGIRETDSIRPDAKFPKV
jgi:hypothetical protein